MVVCLYVWMYVRARVCKKSKEVESAGQIDKFRRTKPHLNSAKDAEIDFETVSILVVMSFRYMVERVVPDERFLCVHA